jgi:YD repeat-containing protein
LFLPPPTNQDTIGRYYEYDGLGSVVGMTNQQGNQVTNYRYEAFGSMAEENGNQGNDLKWMGQHLDKGQQMASGWIYLLAD